MTRANLIRWTGWLLVAVPLHASAQPPTTVPPPTRCATGAVVTGAASGSGSGLMAGAAFGWSAAPRVTLEGSATWIDRAHDSSAFTAAVSALVGERQPGRYGPFAKLGVGVYSTTIDPTGPVDDFYARRMAAHRTAARRTFTDPAVVAGFGLNVLTTRRLSLRPEYTAVVAWRDSRTSVVSLFDLHVIYHFERHVVTPARRTP